jgi:hypothetical protein
MIALNEPMRHTPNRLSFRRVIADEKEKTHEERPHRTPLLGGGRVLGNGLGALRDGMLGEFTGQDQSDTGEMISNWR